LRERLAGVGGDKRRIHEGSRKQRIAEFLNEVVVPWTAAVSGRKSSSEIHATNQTKNQTHNPTTTTNTTNFWSMRLNSN
jgi:hypothetical protein